MAEMSGPKGGSQCNKVLVGGQRSVSPDLCVLCVPRGHYWANTVPTPPLMMLLVVQSAPSASLLMTQVEGGADTVVGCAAPLQDFGRLTKQADRILTNLTRINTKSWEGITTCTSPC